MVYRHFQAHLDDTKTIHLHIPKEFAQTPLTFTVENRQGETLQTTLAQKEEFDHHLLFTLRSKTGADLSQTYFLYDQDRNSCQLIYRGILQTSFFDKHFTYHGKDLGAHYSSTAVEFKVWAPIAEEVLVKIRKKAEQLTQSMDRGPQGVWSLHLSGDWEGAAYTYLVKVNGSWQETHDPFAYASTANGQASLVIDLDKVRSQASRPLATSDALQSVIYEMSVRDFSWQEEAGFKHAGKFKGLMESPKLDEQAIGFDYLKDLGVTHVQLMPIYDFGSVDEQCPAEVYNWGYDPVQYNVPDGSFVDDPDDPYKRLTDLQQVVSSYHSHGIGIIMDVVYNHVYKADTFALQKLTPGYSYRLDQWGNRTNGTFCGNDLASERPMIRNYIRQSVDHWVDLFGIDGFRFDLMGIIDMETMRAIRADHPGLLIYGEGWKMPTGMDEDLLSHQYQAKSLEGIGFFSDDFRNTIKAALVDGALVEHSDFRKALERALSGHQEHFASPDQVIQYIECHDDATVFDHLHHKNSKLSLAQRMQAARFGLHLVLMAQGIAFIHSGQEAFRTKKGIENTYCSPDSINRLDWQRMVEHHTDTGFIKDLIAYRKQQDLLHLTSFEQIDKQVSFVWLDKQVLAMDVTGHSQEIRVIMNFGSRAYTYHNDVKQKLRVQYPKVYPMDQEHKKKMIRLPEQSLIVLEN